MLMVSIMGICIDDRTPAYIAALGGSAAVEYNVQHLNWIQCD